jgi:hypothetical protein
VALFHYAPIRRFGRCALRHTGVDCKCMQSSAATVILLLLLLLLLTEHPSNERLPNIHISLHGLFHNTFLLHDDVLSHYANGQSGLITSEETRIPRPLSYLRATACTSHRTQPVACHKTGCLNIHAILHDLFHQSFLCS